MKTVELLKEEYAILLCQYPSWEELLNDIPHHEIEKHTDEVAKLFAKEVAKEALKNATENATYFLDANDQVQIVKSSITSEENIPTL